jgi:alkylation response protein AidB-like acyl-CoA dehydrogenase
MKTETDSVIDTSRMSPEQRAALELTESAREAAAAERGLVGGLFMGRVHWDALHPFPTQRAEDRDQGDAFLERLGNFLRESVDPDEIDAAGEVPDEVIESLARLGAFGIKIPTEYGGLGLSQTNYCRAATMLGSYCGNLAALISAHQSIGVPQPLLMFGTEEQKRRFLPRVAGGEISAFALTETKVGSDPAKMETHAEPAEDGSHFVINGEKLWCTNGTKAGVIVVMARTPSKDGRNQITAFIVDMDTPGVEVVRRCHFMGLRALYNGVIRFHDVRVPRENILLAEGKGLRVALTTLNTGRLTLPAACTGLAKRCLQISREWAKERVQWGAPIGKHAAIADKIAQMAANVFAMESMTHFAASLVDRDKATDIRLEAAMCKMWASERAWEMVDETMQIRGGRGYETAASLAARGEKPIAVERMMRDARINLIFEGSSEIMRLFIAREALDPHLKIGGPVLNSKAPLSARGKAAVQEAGYYARWYAGLYLPKGTPSLPHARYIGGSARRLARSLFHAMVRWGPKLERQQVLLGRFVDIGAELFAMAATSARAASLDDPAALQLARDFGQMARLRIDALFRGIRYNADRENYRLAQRVTSAEFDWLDEGMLRLDDGSEPQ